MAILTVRNRSAAKTMALYLEPWGEDYWLRPREEATVATGYDFKTDVFAVDMNEHGIQLWVEANQAVVTSRDGTVLNCGHQRKERPR
jgi:hypothetical protein